STASPNCTWDNPASSRCALSSSANITRGESPDPPLRRLPTAAHPIHPRSHGHSQNPHDHHLRASLMDQRIAPRQAVERPPLLMEVTMSSGLTASADATTPLAWSRVFPARAD